MKKGSKRTEKMGTLLPFTPSGDVYYRKGNEFYQRGNFEKALKFFQRARELEPEEPMIPLQMAMIYTEIGEFQLSNDLLNFIHRHLDPEMVEVYYLLANNDAHLGLFQEAHRHATAYLEHDPEGEFAEDAEDLLELLSLEEDEDEDSLVQDELIMHQEKARLFLEKGQFKEAVELLEEVIERYPDYWSAYNNLALAYFYLGDGEQATALLTEVLHRNPGNLHALCNLAVFYHYQERTDELNQLVDALERVRPFLFEHRFKLGATFALVGRHEQAYGWLKSLVKRGFEGDAGFYFWLSHSAWHAGHEKVARDAWARVIKEQPDKEGMEPWNGERPKSAYAGRTQETTLELEEEQYPEERMFQLFKASLSTKRTDLLTLEGVMPSFLTPVEEDYLSMLFHLVHQSAECDSAAYAELRRGHDVAEWLNRSFPAYNQANKGLYYMWFHILYQGRLAGYAFKNPEALAASVEFVWKEVLGLPITKKSVAEKYGISPSTIRKYLDEIDAFLP